MSRFYFHSPSGEAELRGSEYHWLKHVARGPADAAWNLDSSDTLDRIANVLAFVPEVPDGPYGANYLHTMLRTAQAQAATNKAAFANIRPGTPLYRPAGVTHDPERQLRQAFETKLRTEGFPIFIEGIKLHSGNLELNTALAVGSDPIRLAAKFSGWGEEHVWVDGPDRAWMADIIDDGLKVGIYRRGIWYVDGPSSNPGKDPRRKWSDQGWGAVVEFLRARDDEPVVTSYSVCDQFPNSAAAGWVSAPMPEGWVPDWADDEKGREEWERDYPDSGSRLEYYLDRAHEDWYDVPADEQWRLGMDGLRRTRPWARLSPDMLAEYTFHLGVTVYDLFAPDRDERVLAAAADAEDESDDDDH